MRNLTALNPLLRKSHVHTTGRTQQTNQIVILEKPVCYMLVGIPGSGKSTYAETLIKRNPNAVYLSTDQIIEEYAASINSTYNEVFDSYIDQASKLMYQQLDAAVLELKPIIWDQTNLSVKSRRFKLKFLHEYHVKAVVCPIPARPVLDLRLSSREKQVPTAVIDSMIKCFQTPTLIEGFAEVQIV